MRYSAHVRLKLWPIVTGLVISACAPAARGPSTERALTFVIDSTLVLERTFLSIPGQRERPLAAVADLAGNVAVFVADEVLLTGVDLAAAQSIARRWQGGVLGTLDPADFGAEGDVVHLIQVDPSSAEVHRLVRNLRSVGSGGAGEHRVSSEMGLGLLAAAAEEAASGVAVGVNWVATGSSSFTDGTSNEAASGPAPWVPNAASWPSHMTGGPQDIGVFAAWRALELAGKLGNRVRIAVLDGGFFPDQDFPADHVALSTVPGVAATGNENINPFDCGIGKPCPFHGTYVSHVAVAVPDNSFGVAGTGGPVAELITVNGFYDVFGISRGLMTALLSGADIVNLSYYIAIPAPLAWAAAPLAASVSQLRASGILVFASAGNEGANVDATDCLLVCWEKTLWAPCEMPGVICVGGIERLSTQAHADSNWGLESVDIFAPYELYVGPEPQTGSGNAQLRAGTSYSSPFVAGVAALMWAADPSLTPRQVERLLIASAHSSPDPRVDGYVDASAAVGGALRNRAPHAVITNPEDDARRQAGHPVFLRGLADDPDGSEDCCTFTWSSNLDGPLGTGSDLTNVFATVGHHRIELQVTDGLGATGIEQVLLEIVNTAPTASITKPLPGERVFAGVPYVLRGVASDPNEPNGELACANLTWSSDVIADPLPATGCETAVTFQAPGPRRLVLRAEDGGGGVDLTTVGFDVLAAPANLPPHVTVLEPQNGASVGPDEALRLLGSSTDPEGATPLRRTWVVSWPYDRASGSAPNRTVIGRGPRARWTPSRTFPVPCDSDILVRITHQVMDPATMLGSDFVLVRVRRTC